MSDGALLGTTYRGRPCKHGHPGDRYKSNRWCVECAELYKQEWRARNPEQNKAAQRRLYARNGQGKLYARAHRRQNIEAARTANRRWYHNNKDKARANNRKTYGLPEPTRPAPELCECCGGVNDTAMNIDHCHDTGAFRGWLWRRCNLGIGHLGDNIAGVLLAVEYLRRTS